MPFHLTPQANWTDRERLNFFQEIATRFKFATFTFDPANVPAGTTLTTTLTTTTTPQVSGLRTAMPIHVTAPSNVASGVIVDGFVAANDTLSVRIVNTTAVDVNLTSATWAFMGIIP